MFIIYICNMFFAAYMTWALLRRTWRKMFSMTQWTVVFPNYMYYFSLILFENLFLSESCHYVKNWLGRWSFILLPWKRWWTEWFQLWWRGSSTDFYMNGWSTEESTLYRWTSLPAHEDTPDEPSPCDHDPVFPEPHNVLCEDDVRTSLHQK